MMKKFKITALMLSALMTLSLLTGCGSKPQSETDAEAPDQAETPKLVVATHATFPPYEFYENGEPTGIDLDIMQAICDKLGYEMEVADMEFGSIITAVQTGKADVGAAGITKTEDRAKSVNFSSSYATGIQSVIVQEGSSITSLEDLHGEDVIIGVQQDTTGDIYATDDFGEDHILRFNKGADAVQALVTNKCQAVIIDNSPAQIFVSKTDGLTILPTTYVEEEYCFEISYDQPELYEAVNGALEELIDDGTIQKIVDSYITAE